MELGQEGDFFETNGKVRPTGFGDIPPLATPSIGAVITGTAVLAVVILTSCKLFHKFRKAYCPSHPTTNSEPILPLIVRI